MKSWPESWTAKSAALSGVLALLLATGGCAKIADWWNRDGSAEERPPEAVFNELDSDLKRYEEGGWFLEFRLKNTLEDIRKGLSDLRLNHPFSRYAAEAELREADLLFYEDRFEEALAAYHAFAKGHPSHRKVSFALYRGAICYEKQAPRTTTATAFAWIFGDEIAHDRDLSYTLSAYDSAQEIAQNYPHSPEA
ncbi:MAG: outer membrane protein assembly factor BamD, partial [Bdellovibrionota bacterium]